MHTVLVNCRVLSEFSELTLEVRTLPTVPISDPNMFVSEYPSMPVVDKWGQLPTTVTGRVNQPTSKNSVLEISLKINNPQQSLLFHNTEVQAVRKKIPKFSHRKLIHKRLIQSTPNWKFQPLPQRCQSTSAGYSCMSFGMSQLFVLLIGSLT